MAIPTLEDCVLDHIAIAVKSISQAKKVYEDLGFVFATDIEEVKEQKVLTAFANIDQNGHIELLEPTSEESAIHKFIVSKGEGIHHICFRVKDVKAKSEELILKGYKFIYPEPRMGAGGCLVNFMHPKSTGGVLIEISQRSQA